MYFKDVIGQENVKQQLIKEAKERKMAYAHLFCGKSGIGKLPLALAYARYLLCEHPNGQDACGTCASCKKCDNWVHPDLHFTFPIVKKKNKETVCDDYLPEWRELLKYTPYFDLNTWLEKMNATNQQAQIFAKESDEMCRKLRVKPSQGEWKVMIIWMAEKMNAECSNKLLKLLEEPPPCTVFLLTSENPDSLLATIQSRTRRISLPGINENCMTEVLRNQYGLEEQDAADTARQSGGSFLKALEAIHLNEEKVFCLEQFVSLMRLAYQRKIRDLKGWSETMAAVGREGQKNFLNYCQRMVRENFMYNFHEQPLTYLNHDEAAFSKRFSPFINEGNVMEIMDELGEAQKHIEQNVNARMVFFDLALKIIVLLVR